MPNVIILLLVEDAAAIRNILEEGLGDAGFELKFSDNGKSAIAELDADAGVFHAVITDIRLCDGPSGWDVGRHARELNPEMPIVYMSGDSAVEWASQGVPGSIMIQKPFVVAQIVTAVSHLLNKDTV